MKLRFVVALAVVGLIGLLAPSSAWACKGVHKHDTNTGNVGNVGHHANGNNGAAAVGKAGNMNGTVAAVHRNRNGNGGTMAVKVSRGNKKNAAPTARTGKGKTHTAGTAHQAMQIVLLQVLPDTVFERDTNGTLVATDFSAVSPGQQVAMTGVGFQIKTVNILSPNTSSQTAAAQTLPPLDALALR